MSEPKSDAKWIPLASSRFDPDLIRFGERIAALLESHTSQQNDYALATLDDLLGAVHTLIMALHNEPPFVYRPQGQKIETKPLLDRAKGIANDHQIRMTGLWMAGCHFNSAISRLSFVYHRSLKIVTGQLTTRDGVGREDDRKSLIYAAKQVYEGWTRHPWSNENIAKVHTEINGLKHSSRGIYWGRDVKEAEAIGAINELLTLLETWKSRG